MAWDYSIYPDLTESQMKCFQTSGETLFMIQLSEKAIKSCCIYVFNDNPELLFENLFSLEEKVRKKTLGQLINLIKSKTEIHTDFENILTKFLNDRNFFVHNIFNDPAYSLSSDDKCSEIEKFLLDLQDYAWNVQNIFLGCLLSWSKENGVYEHLPDKVKSDKHMKQVQEKGFSRLFEKNDQISVRFNKQKPQ